MAWEVPVYTVALSLSGVFGFVVAGLVWRERPRRGATWLSIAAATIGLWAAGVAVVRSAGGPTAVHLGSHAALLGAVFTPALIFRFVLSYVGRTRDVPAGVRAAVFLVPAALAVMGLLGHSHVQPFFEVVTGADETPLVTRGWFVLAVYGYVNATLLAGEYFLLEKFLRSRNVFRKRSFLLFVLVATLHACHLLTLLGLSPTPPFTLTPLAYLFGGVLSVAMVARRALAFLPIQRLLSPFQGYARSLAPLARDRAIEAMGTGFVVVDHDGRVVDTNPAAKALLGRGEGRIVGKRLVDVIPPERFVDEPPSFLTADPGRVIEGRFDATWVETPGGEERCVDILVTTIEESGRTVGYVALVHDVTERERREQTLAERTRELARQNERLEDFAAVVSHDLRNPLSVASGRLALIESGDDEPHAEAARDALARMEDIVDGVLTFARLGATVEDTEPVDLATVAREAWTNVETGDAALGTDADVTVAADRGRLLQVFENLVRNAVEHGGEDVTVTVGATAEGFFVADDGQGVPSEDRAEVLERGFSTDPEGTGFGLAIVRTIVEAHGWEISVGESAAGGARFDVAGVETVDRESSRTA